MELLITLLENALNLIIGLLGFGAATIIGLITIVIQIRQKKLQGYQYQLDMYEKRFEYYKRLKKSFPFSDSELEKLLFMDGEAFKRDDFVKYQAFYLDARSEFKFVFGTESFELLKQFNSLMHQWQTSTPNKKTEIADKMESLYFDKLIPEMEKLLMLKVI
ncbi:hypothetical protein [uncultured Draconibacterium sp.]|uniref:hypothetical protein n=1 Tax=uncultured Draconibacterium sp. TaxID=1573823 RepID=UPI0029C65935|nr:hypothetical protein [uncultured Draconibacterium sp.]